MTVFYCHRLTGRLCIEFLVNILSELLGEVFLNTIDAGTMTLLRTPLLMLENNTILRNKWIGLRGTVLYPARSSDLNSLDFFLWGHLKCVVYESRADPQQNLVEQITEVENAITNTPGIF